MSHLPLHGGLSYWDFMGAIFIHLVPGLILDMNRVGGMSILSSVGKGRRFVAFL